MPLPCITFAFNLILKCMNLNPSSLKSLFVDLNWDKWFVQKKVPKKNMYISLFELWPMWLLIRLFSFCLNVITKATSLHIPYNRGFFLCILKKGWNKSIIYATNTIYLWCCDVGHLTKQHPHTDLVVEA